MSIFIYITACMCGIFAFTGLLRWMKRKSSKGKTDVLSQALKKLKKHETLREDEYNALINESGYQEKLKFMNKIDQMIEHSDVRKIAPQAPTEAFLLLFGACGILAGMLGAFVSGSLMHGIWTGVIVLAVIYAALNIASDRKYRSIETQIKPFIDYAEGYAATSDDIVSILYKTSGYLKPPLSGYLEDFHRDAIHVGKDKAFEKLESRINHKQMQELIHNLNMCSKYNSDYRQIFRDASESVELYLDGKADRTAVKKSNKRDIITIVIMCFVCFTIFGQIIQEQNVFAALNETLTGRAMFLGLAGFLLVTLYEFIRTDKK